MQTNFCKPKKGSALLKGLCVILPAAVLVAAHHFPWRKLLRRDLHPLETYSIGTAAIVGTAGLAIALSAGDSDDHVTMLGLATVSAGVTTIASYAVDEIVDLRGKVASRDAENQALKGMVGNDGDDI